MAALKFKSPMQSSSIFTPYGIRYMFGGRPLYNSCLSIFFGNKSYTLNPTG